MIQQLLFEGKGFKVKTATNGYDAFQTVKNSILSRKEEELFDLVVLDLNMPIENGYEAAAMISKLYNDSSVIEIDQEVDSGDSKVMMRSESKQIKLV